MKLTHAYGDLTRYNVPQQCHKKKKNEAKERQESETN